MISQTVLITGVGQRVGLELAYDFLNRGFNVIGTYRTERPVLENLEALGAKLYQCDFQEDQQLELLVNSICNEQDTLRAIIHNASDWLPDKSGEPLDVISKMMKVHVHAPYVINLGLASLLQKAKPIADIIHFSDYVASTGSDKHCAYAASKAALENMTLSFATRFAPQIKVNAIAPALIKFNHDDNQDYREKTLKKALIPREGGYQEVISTVNYLLDSRYITGRILSLDGGRHLAKLRINE